MELSTILNVKAVVESVARTTILVKQKELLTPDSVSIGDVAQEIPLK